jgi:hypothetical protein
MKDTKGSAGGRVRIDSVSSRRLIWGSGLGVILAGGALVLYLGGLRQVPFHPDESTQVHMSQDFATLVLEGAASALAWRPDEPMSAEMRYRLLDAPWPRYLIGLGWWLAGFTRADLNLDWVWAESWQVNLAEGRIPRAEVLLAGRTPAAVLGALTVVLVFALGALARGLGVGLAAALLFGLHPLMLLHSRRAMAEGPLLFASTLAMLAAVLCARQLDGQGRFNWRSLSSGALTVGALAGLAFSSKQSAIALIPALLAPAALAIWRSSGPQGRQLEALVTLGLAAVLAASLVFLMLNPVAWAAPKEALGAMLVARVTLVQSQTATLGQLAAGQTLPTVADRLRAALLHLFLQPPAVWDVAVANHLGYLKPQAEAYFAAPLHRTWPAVGALLLGLTMAGLAFSGLRVWRDRLGPATRAEQAFWAWSLAVVAFTALAVPLDWQRYFLPLLPPACLFAALGADGLMAPLFAHLIRSRERRHD